MSHPSSIQIVSNGETPAFVATIAQQNSCEIIDATWPDALSVFEASRPAAVIAVASEGCGEILTALANAATQLQPYTPIIACGLADAAPPTVLIGPAGDDGGQLANRLKAALRTQTLHATVLRRAADLGVETGLPVADAEDRPAVLLFGRGRSYPGLSIALGERFDLVGALSVEAAARHLNLRDIDGVFIGEGFNPRLIEGFLTVLSEDVRFRSLPVIMTGRHAGAARHPQLANLETMAGDPAFIAASAAGMIRQHAFETQLTRTLAALDSNGLLDPRTGLLTPDSFERDFAQTVSATLESGGHLSAAQISFDMPLQRTPLEAARVVSRLMRKMDFATLQDDGSIIAAFTQTDLRAAHVIARRLAAILQSTVFAGDGQTQLSPRVTLATLKANDSADAIRERLMSVTPPQPDLRTRLGRK